MRKGILILSIAVLAVIAGCVSQNTFNDKYTAYQYNGTAPAAQFSFEYPENGTVEIVQSTISTPEGRKDAPNLLVYVPYGDEKLQIQIVSVPNFDGLSLAQRIEKEKDDIVRQPNLIEISHQSARIAGVMGEKFLYEYDSNITTGFFHSIRRIAFFESGGYHYFVHLTHFTHLNSSRADAAYERILKTFAFTAPSGAEGAKVFCTPESRNADACLQLYEPVCGWSDPEKIQCIKYPCAQTFSNNCFACADGNVLYYTDGKCPE